MRMTSLHLRWRGSICIDRLHWSWRFLCYNSGSGAGGVSYIGSGGFSFVGSTSRIGIGGCLGASNGS